jgi:hypothetical protein
MRHLVFSISLTAVFLSGCITAPELPGETVFPVEEILRTATCDLQNGFKHVSDNKEFKPDLWLVSVKLAPKAFTDLYGNVGGTRKSVASGLPMITWTLGTPGANLDIKGTQSGDATFEFKSATLLQAAASNFSCNNATKETRELREKMGIGDWLERTSSAMAGDRRINRMNGLTYTTDLTVRFSANGTYSYVFAKGSDLAGIGGWYEIQKTLTISMAPIIVPYRPLVSLPNNPKNDGEFGPPRAAVPGRDLDAAIERARQQNEFNFLQQSIQGIRPTQ